MKQKLEMTIPLMALMRIFFLTNPSRILTAMATSDLVVGEQNGTLNTLPHRHYF
ncbi:MAG: hypothetical protein H0A76_10095 [Candidatus Thiodubiliella endoseptemdiera]|uniref:Uncharacterized protein n=1 Tax=Candidatus Thiodubiliella endoseptemdiera TaxID=2738886 RepID=A0A853F492_9GAMM|nr:hypothetical protein [Candidatus Thiodubiliella endoseptemdiera]